MGVFLVAVACSAVLLLGDCRGARPENGHRRLSQEHFISYEPATTVTDDAAIDLDLRDMIYELAKQTTQGEENARNIYMHGAYSKSYAQLTLDDSDALLVDVAEGTIVVGKTVDGTEVMGKVRKTVKRGETKIDFQYHASPIQSRWTNCHVGGNPNPNLSGCLASTGTIDIDDLGTFSYTYDPEQENQNARTLQSLSAKAKEKMFDCADGCPYPTFLKFYNYYGFADYGDHWIMAAFNNTQTTFDNGNAQFERYTGQKRPGAYEAILKGAAVLNVWMYVIRELEHAATSCFSGKSCTGEDCTNDDRVHAWDKAVAFYTGSEPKLTQSGGYLLYSLAQKRCNNFGTCLTTGQELGMANVNSDVYKSFQQGKQELIAGNCPAVMANAQRVTELMTVPLIQGVLRYAYHQDDPSEYDINQAKTEGEGATYAAALLPLVYACSEADAAVVYDNMRVGSTANFGNVKAALERNYDCLGVTCSDVGGLLDAARHGDYMSGAEPCGSANPTPMHTDSSGIENGSKPDVGLAVGLSLFLAFALVMMAAALKKREKAEFELEPVVEAELT